MRRQRVKYFVDSISWYFNKKWHRDKDLPTIYVFKGKNLFFIYYCQHGKDHNANGPAFIDYESKIKRYYYQDRKYASLEEILMMEACR